MRAVQNSYRCSARPSNEEFAFKGRKPVRLVSFVALFLATGFLLASAWYLGVIFALVMGIALLRSSRPRWKRLRIDREGVEITDGDGSAWAMPLSSLDSVVDLTPDAESIRLVQLDASFRKDELAEEADFRRIVWCLVDGVEPEDAATVLEVVGARSASPAQRELLTG